MIVAIDGPAGSGKSTTARAVAEDLGYQYLDTGAMYRAVGLAFHRAGVAGHEPEAQALLAALQIDLVQHDAGLQVLLNGEDVSDAIRTAEAGAMASQVATLEAVREKLVAEQQRLGQQHVADGLGVVLEGRDIGTVVFPEARVKIYLIAEARVRAERRQAQLAEKGQHVPLEQLLRDIEARDKQDSERAIAPLRKADDAVLLDTTNLTIGEQVVLVRALVRERSANA